MKKGLLAAVLAGLVLWVGSNLYDSRQPTQPSAQQGAHAEAGEADMEEGAMIGQQAPDFVLKTLDGNSVRIHPAQDGKLYVLNFWATWCPPCQAEIPELEAFATAHANNLDFYAVNLQESAEDVQDFLTQRGHDFPVLLDSGEAAKSFRIRAIPMTVIIDRNGIIRFQKIGMTNREELEQALAKLPKES